MFCYNKNEHIERRINMTYKKLQNGSDIRGVALEGIDGEDINLTEQAVYDLSRAFGTWLRKKRTRNMSRWRLGAIRG